MGLAGLVPWLAHPMFVILLVAGWVSEEIGRVGLAILIALWLIGWIVFPRVFEMGNMLFPVFVAILDVVLVLIVFKGDVRLR